MKRIISAILISIFALSTIFMSGCDDHPELADLSKKDRLVYDVIYSLCDDQAKEDTTEKLLEKLDKESSVTANLWRSIIDYYKSAYTDSFTNIGNLPDGLPQDNSLCIVVLGFALNADGSMKSELVERLNVALSCANKYPNSYILVTGGGTASDNPKVTEANNMADWLERQGISKDRIIIENQSTTTVENAQFTTNILLNNYPQVKNIAIVSSDYHIPWACVDFFAQIKFMNEKNNTNIHLDIISNAASNSNSWKYNDPDVVLQQCNNLWDMYVQYNNIKY